VLIVRSKLARGSLPQRGTAHPWGGTGNGSLCDACERPVEESHPEITVEVDADESLVALRFHPHCYSIWRSEISELG
jgi:hypothetical protein